MKKEQQWQNLKKQLSYLNFTAKIPSSQNHKHSLTKTLSDLLAISLDLLHLKICDHLVQLFTNSKLPRKISYIYNDPTIIQDYKSDPDLASFAKITLEIASNLFEKKISVYYIGVDKWVNCLIVNEGGYPDASQMRVGRVGISYCIVVEANLLDIPILNNQNSQEQLKLHDLFKSQTNLEIKDQTGKYDATRTPHIKSSNSIKNRSKSIVPDKRSIDNVSFHAEENSHNMSPTHYQDREAQHLISSCNQDNTIRDPTNIINIHQSPQYIDLNSNFYSQYHSNIYYSNQPYIFKPQPGRSQGFIGYSNNPHPTSPSPPRKTPILSRNESLANGQKERYTGRLKFFDQGKNYGFIIMDADESDIFVHYDDLHKAGIAKDKIKSYKQNEGLIRFSFKVMEYYGKYKQSRKAVQLIIIGDDDQFDPLITS